MASSLASCSLFPFTDEDVGGIDPGRLRGENDQTVQLFQPLQIRSLCLKNRIYVAPMCQYSSEDGYFSDYHLVHLGQFALGGAGLVTTEATAVAKEGRISPQDAGLWKDEHIAGHKRVVDFLHAFKTAASIQLGHSGRKGSTFSPFWNTREPSSRAGIEDSEGGWIPCGPSAVPWSPLYRLPHELTHEEIQTIVDQFGEAARRANECGYDCVELHGAHGYLLFEFLSPTSNQRTDEYGGSFENRIRFPLQVVQRVRQVWPAEKPLFYRLSCIEWLGPDTSRWTIEDTCKFAIALQSMGVDLLHASSGGNSPEEKIEVKPGYQLPFAAEIKQKVPDLLVGAVGLITEPQQAEEVLKNGQADCIFLARQFLRDPHFPLRAAKELGVRISYPPQYSRAPF